jgi:small subunit ribosomal protein S16
MAVRIRLRRMGKKKHPAYRLAVVDSRVKRDGRFIEFVGFYDPMTQPRTVKLNEERIFDWMRNGASCSDTVRSIFREAGILRRWHEMHLEQKAAAAAEAKPEKSAAKAVKAKAEKAASPKPRAARKKKTEEPAAAEVSQPEEKAEKAPESGTAEA